MKKVLLTVLAGIFVLGVSLDAAQAIAPFKKEFDEKYVKKESADPKDQEFAAAVKKANCLVCHAKNAEGKEDKKIRNAYGKALDILLDKKTDAKDVAKIQGALDTVAKEKSNPDDPNSPTFGDLIASGKLPGGN
jgi:cytochrome c553